MDAKSNWLPFAYREVFKIDIDPVTLLGLPTSVQLGSFGVAGGPGALLQDFNLLILAIRYDQRTGMYEWSSPGEVEDPFVPFIRYGYKHLGYLTEQSMPYAAHVNMGEVVPRATWNFLRPYRLFPGNVMRASYKYTGDSQEEIRWPRKPGMIFNGVRVLDDKPVLLYSTTNKMDDLKNSMVLNQGGFTCPADSPVDIHGVSAFGMAEEKYPWAGAWQITGPDDREWFITRSLHVEGLNQPWQSSWERWLSLLGSYTKLGEDWGWSMGQDETFIAEVSVDTPADKPEDFYAGILTLRGSAEVTYG
jgi:hypothetical protein